jgi:hypothetical protein
VSLGGEKIEKKKTRGLAPIGAKIAAFSDI